MFALTAFAVGDPFYPCQSSSSTLESTKKVICNGISVEKVKEAFQLAKTKKIGSFFLKTRTRDRKIPAGITGQHKIGKITLECPSRKTNPLIVDPAAFNSTKSSTVELNVKNCDLQKLDWSFLKNFSYLTTLNIFSSSNLHLTFYTLPTATLKNLRVFFLNTVMGLNGFKTTNLAFPAPPPSGLSTLWIWYCYDFDSPALQIFLAKWVTPTSALSLSSFHLGANSFTEFPSEIKKYTEVQSFGIWANAKPLNIPKGSFDFRGEINFVDLDLSKISFISPGAFKGNFVLHNNLIVRKNFNSKCVSRIVGDFFNSLVLLGRNNITTLDSRVFQSMILQMSTSNGFLDLYGSK